MTLCSHITLRKQRVTTTGVTGVRYCAGWKCSPISLEIFDSKKICEKQPPNGSVLQFHFILELLMLLGFMSVTSLKEWRIFQLSVCTLMEIVCFYGIKVLWSPAWDCFKPEPPHCVWKITNREMDRKRATLFFKYSFRNFLCDCLARIFIPW